MTVARIQTHTQNIEYLLLFYDNNGYANAPQCYFIRILSDLFRPGGPVHFRDSARKRGMSYLIAGHEPWLADLNARSAVIEDSFPSLLESCSSLPHSQESVTLAILWTKCAQVTSRYNIPVRSTLQTLPHLHLISHVIPSPDDSRPIFYKCFPPFPCGQTPLPPPVRSLAESFFQDVKAFREWDWNSGLHLVPSWKISEAVNRLPDIRSCFSQRYCILCHIHSTY
jgi:hypothetical protein